MIAPIYLKIAFQVDFWLFMSKDTNPESVEKREREKVAKSERMRGGPLCFRDSGAKGKKVGKMENKGQG